MTTESEIKQAITAIRYHNRLKTANDPSYIGSSLEADSLEALTTLTELHKRMTESNRSDFIGGEI